MWDNIHHAVENCSIARLFILSRSAAAFYESLYRGACPASKYSRPIGACILYHFRTHTIRASGYIDVASHPTRFL